MFHVVASNLLDRDEVDAMLADALWDLEMPEWALLDTEKTQLLLRVAKLKRMIKVNDESTRDCQ